MLAEPEVARWWSPGCDVRDDLAEQPAWSIVAGGTVVGWLLVDEERDEGWRYVGFDIAPSGAGRGSGHALLVDLIAGDLRGSDA